MQPTPELKITGRHNWVKIGKQEFTDEESVHASDFADIVVTYGWKEEELHQLIFDPNFPWYIKPEDLKIHQRMVLAKWLPVTSLKEFIKTEKDPRLKVVIQTRIRHPD